MSVSPRLTERAIVVGIALVVLTVGFSRHFKQRPEDLRSLVHAVVALSVVFALFAVIQKATFNGKPVLGIRVQGSSKLRLVDQSQPLSRVDAAGNQPTAGCLVGQMQASFSAIKPGWRNRIVWISSAEASRVLLLSAAILVMLTSILWGGFCLIRPLRSLMKGETA